MKAEVIAIGDELVSGQRLDTNSQWITQRLHELGITVCRHATIGDDLKDIRDAFAAAVERADVIICTGGLGPTEDDLTRQALAELAEVELEFHQPSLEHIQSVFQSYDREMPESNRVQAYFPRGASVVPNPDGTAPGVDFEVELGQRGRARIVALPGVPAELKQMWEASVVPIILHRHVNRPIIRHHAIHCFGAGESHVQSMLPGILDRARNPLVGITASSATITLRITATGKSLAECDGHIESTSRQIIDHLGDLIFGYNDQTIEGVVLEQLSELGQTLALCDACLDAMPIHMLAGANREYGSLAGGEFVGRLAEQNSATSLAENTREHHQATYGIAIAPAQTISGRDRSEWFEAAFVADGWSQTIRSKLIGHPEIRIVRAAKHVINQFRLEIRQRQ